MGHVKIEIIILSTNFPTKESPQKGIHVFNRVRRMHKFSPITVVAPLPWFPKARLFNRFKEWYKYSKVQEVETTGGIRVYHPRYFMLPGVSGPFLGFLMFIGTYGLLRKLKKSGKCDVINAHFVYPEGMAATLASVFLKVPVVLSALGSDINSYKRFIFRRMQIKWSIKKAWQITAVSDALKDEIIKLGADPSKITAIPNGVDRKIFYPTPKDASRKTLGLEKDCKYILFVGTFDRLLRTVNTTKGIEYLIEAASILKQDFSGRFKLILIGDGKLKKAMKKKAETLSLSGTICFLENKPPEDIALWISACDVLTRPSLMDGMPNVILEALACGRPVVASRVGGIPELISSKNGILVEPKNPQSIANGLKEVLQKQWNEKDIASTAEQYSWDKTAQGYFKQIIKAGGAHKQCQTF